MASRLRSVVWLGLGLVGCAAPKPQPAAPAPIEPVPVAEIAEESPDLSPVPTPAGLFALGRLTRPLAISDAVLGWAGLPLSLRQILPEKARGLDRAIAWDAPVEFAFVLSATSSKHPVQAFVSLGLTSVDVAREVATEQGYELERLAPGVHAVGGVKGAVCAIAPALGSASARLVCASRRSELEEVVPYATRGLPNERFGSHDLDFELRAEPVRQKFGTVLSSARLFAGFLLSRIALDAPRFDSAVSDATYGLADEAVALVGDLDVLRVEGTLDRERQVLEVDASLKLRSKKSFTAGLIEESAGRAGPTPAAFFKLPAEASSGGFSYAVEPKRWDGVRRVVGDIFDAYLEHEKVKKPARERARRLTETLFQLSYPVTVFADGQADASSAAKGSSNWSILRSDLAPAKLRPALVDLHALLSDRALRAALSRRFQTDEKALPSARLGRLTGAGIPAGTQALTISVSRDLGKQLGDRMGVGPVAKMMPDADFTIAVVADGSGSLVGIAPTAKELAARLGPMLSGKGSTFADRPELAGLRDIKATGARFTSVEALAGELDVNSTELERALSSVPNHGRLPILIRFDAEVSPVLTGRVHMTVPAGAFADLPGLAPLLLDQLSRQLSK